jgi:hypothetical protein
LLAALSGPAAAAESGRVVVATAARGVFYFHGVQMPPPITFSVGWSLMDGDTTWSGIYADDMPLYPTPPPSVPNHVDSLWVMRFAAYRAALSRVTIPEGVTQLERNRLCAQVYASLDALVDSARAISAEETIVYWKGDSNPSRLTIRPDAHLPTKEKTRDLLLREAHRSALFVESGALLIGSAGMMAVPRSSVPELEFEVAQLRRGLKVPLKILSDPVMADELIHPTPLPPRER